MACNSHFGSIEIASRFRGPPDSGNGGYVCGLLARSVDGVATVRLLAPPPLATPLAVREVEGILRLQDGERAVAQARASSLDLVAPPAPSLEQAEAASKRFAGHHMHPFPGCFVCGPERTPDEALCIFPGAVEGRDLVAAPWTPAADLAGVDGRVRTEFIWSALDCTGFFAFAPLPDGSPALLGELTARIDGDVMAGDAHIVAGWPIAAEGRKRIAGSVIYRADGAPLAVARATWIVVAQGTAGAVDKSTVQA